MMIGSGAASTLSLLKDLGQGIFPLWASIFCLDRRRNSHWDCCNAPAHVSVGMVTHLTFSIEICNESPDGPAQVSLAFTEFEVMEFWQQISTPPRDLEYRDSGLFSFLPNAPVFRFDCVTDLQIWLLYHLGASQRQIWSKRPWVHSSTRIKVPHLVNSWYYTSL